MVAVRRLPALMGIALMALSALPAAAAESDRLNAFLDEVHEERVARWPEWQTSLGLKTNYDRWNDRSDGNAVREHDITIRNLLRLHREFDYDRLDQAAKISCRLFERRAEQSIEWFPFRHNRYAVNHRDGPHNGVPDFLMNRHKIDDRGDAEAYVARLRGVPQVMDQTIARLAASAAIGVVPPRFVFPKVLADIAGFLTGLPFEPDAKNESVLLADFRKKVGKLNLPDADKDALVAAATAALAETVKPAYMRLRDAVAALEKRATDDAGVWKFPDGETVYALSLRWRTTTDLTPDEIHAYGLSEVARIHKEMRAVGETLGFKGDLKALFDFVRHDASNFYPNDDAGRATYLADTRAKIAEMNENLDRVFSLKPKAGMVVKRVEAYREKTAGIGFYNSPSAYGDRPGMFYVNLHDMSLMPKSHLEALAYHEGIPGHHLQIAIARELEGLPKFRKFAGNTAFIEGWGLYAERLAKEMGFYREPMSDVGRLAWELLRAARLVVDIGIHHKRWTREEAIAYLDRTLPVGHAVNEEAIERYIVWPAQATAYKIGMREFLALRESARKRLGPAFDLRDFHRVVLGNGALPLDMLREVVDQWVAAGGG